MDKDIIKKSDEERTLLSSVIDKAESLLDELEAYAELEKQGGDLIDWFYRKYKEQAA